MNIKRIPGIAIIVVPILLAGCGAGSANIPASLPKPRKMNDVPGKNLADMAQSKGMSMPSQPAEGSQPPPANRRGFNPTNPN